MKVNVNKVNVKVKEKKAKAKVKVRKKLFAREGWLLQKGNMGKSVQCEGECKHCRKDPR